MRVTHRPQSKTLRLASSGQEELARLIGQRVSDVSDTRRVHKRNGYFMAYCNRRKRYVYMHRLVIEAQLGRDLDRREVVHHKNHDGYDNRPSNLILLEGQGAHARHHVEEGTWGWPKGTPKPWQEKPKIPCPVCGRDFKPRKHGTRVTKTCSFNCGQTLRYQDRPHGVNRYKSGCRCQDCRGAWAKHFRDRRARRKASLS